MGRYYVVVAAFGGRDCINHDKETVSRKESLLLIA